MVRTSDIKRVEHSLLQRANPEGDGGQMNVFKVKRPVHPDRMCFTKEA